MNIQAPNQWGARVDYDRWRDTFYQKDKIIVHWNGPAVWNYDTGISREQAFMRGVETYHLDRKGWRGFAYGWGIGYSGTVYRARGWNNYGAHAGDLDDDDISENREGIPVFFILGEGQEPSLEMWASFAELRDLLQRDQRSDGQLEVYGHKDVKATTCPGPLLYADVLDKVWEASVALTLEQRVARLERLAGF